MRRRKLLVFSQSNIGGAERMAVTVTKSLNRELFGVVYYLVSMESGNKYPLAEFIPEDKTVKHIKKHNALVLAFKLFLILLREKPDVVFSSVFYLNNKVLLFRNLFPKTTFIIRCENYVYTFSEKQKQMMKKLYPKADRIIAQTEEMGKGYEELIGCKNKIQVLHNPIDKETIDKKIAQSASPFPQNNIKRFVASGRFTEQKGFDLLVKAFALAIKEVSDAELYIIGKNDGDNKNCYDGIIDIAKTLGVEEKIHCVGFQSNPYKYVKHADCFVLSSRWEGLPNVMIESLYLGTPVAAFKCIPIIERIVSEGENGYLAEAENVNALAAAMTKAIQLGRVESYYHSADISDFEKLFMC